jgi:4-alpha-glucanotransferase
LGEDTKNHLHAVLNNSQPNMPQALIQLALDTKANIAIIPMQDILGLGAEHRMNTPGTTEKNWRWRFDWDMLKAEHVKEIKQIIRQSNRVH